MATEQNPLELEPFDPSQYPVETCPRHGPYQVACVFCLDEDDDRLEAMEMLAEMQKGRD